MSSVTIRPATLSDLPTLLEYEQGVIEAERPFVPQMKNTPFHYYDIGELIKADNCHLLVAVEAEQIVACGYARIEAAKPYLKHDQIGYLGFMFVHPDCRGRGLVGDILSGLEQWLVSKDVCALHLDVFAENQAAISAYKKAGFTPYLVDMRKML